MLRGVRHIARWDLDKTYLRTEFATMRDIVRTALERPDEKRSHPGATTLLRRMIGAGSEIHILSGSPEQLRSRLEEKLRLDGIVWTTFTLKPNLRNVLRLRFRAVRDQLGYKLPMLLAARAAMPPKTNADPASDPIQTKETLLGDDAEADAFVYALYSDIVRGNVSQDDLRRVLEAGNVYPDVVAQALVDAARIANGPAVERILIHLEGQSPPSDFAGYGQLVVPFYNYLQAAFVLWQDRRLDADGVIDVARELVVDHRFDGEQLARSYRDLRRRGHVDDQRLSELTAAANEVECAWGQEMRNMCQTVATYLHEPKDAAAVPPAAPDYAALVARHNQRRKVKH
jgi:hypothetical protein